MEHLARPREPIRPIPLIPVFSNKSYDGGPFLEYLERHPNTLFSDEPLAYEITDDDVKMHYQNWLFFGLLQEILGDMFDETDYIRFDEGRGYLVLTTDTLPRILKAWETERLGTIRDEDPKLLHFVACLDEVARLLKTAPWNFPGHDEELGWQLDCIASIAELLEYIISEHCRNAGDYSWTSAIGSRDWLNLSYQRQKDIYDQTVEQMRREGGWCPSDISQAMDRFGTCDAWYYLSNIRLNNRALTHDQCGEHACNIHQSSGGKCIPQHLETDCFCTSFEVSQQRLTEIYTSGAVPCLTFPSKREFRGSKFTPSHEKAFEILLDEVKLGDILTAPYIAISHVWSNGTGNSEGNSLPKCQLWKMFTQAQGWRDANFPESRGTPVTIWIDTVCCPYERGYGKNLALSKMRDIYGHAEFVLVVDRTLSEFNQRAEAEPLECLARLFFSPWMRRLWTAQEAILAGYRPRYTIVVSFGNIIWDWTTLYRQANRDDRAQRFAMDLSREFIWLEKGIWYGVEDEPPLGDLRTTAIVLQYRSTSFAGDEALVLANLLRFPIENFIGLCQEDAMCQFWKEVSQAKSLAVEGFRYLQPQLVFYPAPKLQTPGFRWAPRSFLNAATQKPDLFFCSDSRLGNATLTSRGLMAAYPSLRLRSSPMHRSICLDKDLNCERGAHTMMMEMPDGSGRLTNDYPGDETLETVGSRALVEKYNLCLLTRSTDIPFERTYIPALWVHLKEEIDGVKYGRILEPTFVAQMQSNSVELFKATKECGRGLLRELDDIRRSTAQDVHYDTIAKLRDKHVRQYLDEHPSVMQVIKWDTRKNVFDRLGDTFEDCARSLTRMVHYYCHIGEIEVEVYPDQTMWCLD